MKYLHSLALVALALSALLPQTNAGEGKVPGLTPNIQPKAPETIQLSPLSFPPKLRTGQFLSSEKARTSWRAVLRDESNGVRIGLKVGTWDQPGPQAVKTVWTANKVDWAASKRSYRDAEFSYEFGESTPGVSCVFKLSSSPAEVGTPTGGQTLNLTYGESGVSFKRGSNETAGQLTFKIKNGTKVTIMFRKDNLLDILIDGQPILADQEVDQGARFVSIIAQTEDTNQPGILHLSNFGAKLVPGGSAPKF